ncbi:MAG: SEL1-like repeat protein [Caulobacterales bacterium]|nr:SEL1-like repeat protein [Caulobacterales bacterium]
MSAVELENIQGRANDPACAITGDDLYRLGLAYSTGQDRPLDYVEAHKWFNLAALRGSDAAKVYRKELAEQMTNADVAAAQRSAREWLSAREAHAKTTAQDAAA